MRRVTWNFILIKIDERIEEGKIRMGDVKKRLTEKISTSDLFIVLGTRKYVVALKENGEDIATQVNIARELKKPFFVVIDRNLSKEDRQYLDEYFSKDNIISRMEVDINNRAFTAYVAKEIKILMRELRTMEDDDSVTIVTQYDDDK